MKKITSDIINIGVNDYNVDLFEGQYKVPNGMAYNSYLVLDEEISVFDTVDAEFKHQWLDNIYKALDGKKPQYLIVQHMEPDHSANIANFAHAFPEAKIVANEKTFTMMNQFFGTGFEDRRIVVGNGETLTTGTHTFTFVFAPMVHWPEVMMTYDSKDKALFSADGFGKFGASDADEDWACEARRYYFGIVGKYGAQVQSVLKKLGGLEVEHICPLHGPTLSEDLGQYIKLYNTWSSYEAEDEGIVVAYTSVYGNTKKAVDQLVSKLTKSGCPNVVVHDLCRCDMSEAVEDAFRYSKLILATTTYNSEIFPFMREFIDHLVERNYQKRMVAFIENGSWAPMANRVMKAKFEKSKDLILAKNSVTILSAVNDASTEAIDKLVAEMCLGYTAVAKDCENNLDLSAMFKIGYGLYVVTSNDGTKDNGLIVNTVTQITNTPNRLAVTINKQNYSHHVIKQTGKLNVNCLTIDAPFSVYENFGFRCGRDVDKFADMEKPRSENGLVYLDRHINAFMSLDVIDYSDFGTHGMFVCDLKEARVLSNRESVTYSYYQEHVKPKPETEGKTGWVCDICGYIYEDENLPDDYICPLCKHGVADFSKL